MPTEKRVKGVVIPRHDTMLNWSKALNFVPAKGELIVYDADSAEVVASGYDVSSIVIGTTSYSITPSDKPRFKFGNGVDNVNVLPFAAAQADGYVTYDEMVAYVSEHGGTGGGDDSQIVVYLDEERVMGRVIQMDDVYPLQNDMEFEIRSRNLFNPQIYHVDGELTSVTADASSFAFEKEIGKEVIVTFDDIELPTEGDFTVSNSNRNIRLSLYNDSNLVYEREIEAGVNQYTFNAKDLGVNRAVIYTVIPADSDSGSVMLQFEAGNLIAANTNNIIYTPYTTELSNIKVNVYGRNILAPIENITVSTSASISGPDIVDDNLRGKTDTLGQKYFHCYGTGCTFGDISTGTPIATTPSFYSNVNYTVLYTVLNIDNNTATLGNFQVVLGHITEAPYEEYLCNTVTSDENGKLSNEFVQYPYCTALLATNNSNVTIYAKYDPAINQDTIDSQFEEINRRLDALEAGGVVGGGSNVVVSETEPTDENVDVWIKPSAYIGEYIAESQAGTSATEWTYTVSSNNIFIGGVNADYNATITTAEERVQAINAAFPVTFKYIPAVTVTLSNTDGDEHWIESQTVTNTALQDVTFAMLAAESATISGTLNITVIGVVA